MWNTTLHGLTPTQKPPTSSLDYHHHKYEEDVKLEKCVTNGRGDRSRSGEAGGLSSVWDHQQQIYTCQKKAMRIKTLTLESAVKPYITFQEYVLCMLHSWKKKVLKSELHEFFPGLFDLVFLWAHQQRMLNNKEYKAVMSYTWCWWCHISSLYNNCYPSPHWVSLVPALVLAVPQILLLLLLLHSHPSLLFPALFSTVRIVGGSVALFGSRSVVAVELRLLGQLVLTYDATFVLAGALGVSPGLLLSRGKDGVEDHPWIVHHRRNNKDILPLQACLWREQKIKACSSGRAAWLQWQKVNYLQHRKV